MMESGETGRLHALDAGRPIDPLRPVQIPWLDRADEPPQLDALINVANTTSSRGRVSLPPKK